MTEPSKKTDKVSDTDKTPEHWDWLWKYDAFIFNDKGTRP